MDIEELLKRPLAVACIEKGERRRLIAVVPLDLDHEGPRFGRITRFDWYDAEDLLPIIGERIVLTAGTDALAFLPVRSVDILDFLGEPSLDAACRRRGISYEGPAGEEALDDVRAVAALAQLIVAGEPV